MCRDSNTLKDARVKVLASGERFRCLQPDNDGKIAGLEVSSLSTIDQLIERLPVLFEDSNNMKGESQREPQESLEHVIERHQLQQKLFEEIIALYRSEEYNSILLDDDCTRIRISGFLEGSQHFLELDLPELKLKDHSLPSCIDWQQLLGKCPDSAPEKETTTTTTTLSLTEIVEQFTMYLNDLQDFYENFRTIDELCHVVRPAKPSSKDNWRMFVLKERVFLKVSFADPFAPFASMTINIIGPTREISSLRSVYSRGLHDWDPELDVHKNLLRIFDLCYFPMPPPPVANINRRDHLLLHSVKSPPPEQSDENEEHLSCCSICFCYELDSEDGMEIPIVSCDNARCSLISHITCLRKWFATLADGKTYLNVTFGICPFCKTVNFNFHFNL